MCAWDGPAFRSTVARGLAKMAGAVVTWTLANHDVHRAVTRFGLIQPDTGPAPRPCACAGVGLEWLDVPGRPDVVAYQRGPVTVVVFGSEPFTPPSGWAGLPSMT